MQNGLISALGIPPEDFFQIIHVLPRGRFLHTPSFLGLKYSDDLIIFEITFISGRPKEKRLALLKAVNDGVVAAAGISPDDLLITLYETPGENISFGRSLAQRAPAGGLNALAQKYRAHDQGSRPVANRRRSHQREERHHHASAERPD